MEIKSNNYMLKQEIAAVYNYGIRGKLFLLNVICTKNFIRN